MHINYKIMNKELSVALAEKLKVFVEDQTLRCVNKNTCKYSGASLNRSKDIGCMVGLFFSPEDRIIIDTHFGADGDSSVLDLVNDYNKKKLDIEVPQIILDNPTAFMVFQGLHDDCGNWDEVENTLSTMGKNALKIAIDDYKLDISDFEFAF